MKYSFQRTIILLLVVVTSVIIVLGIVTSRVTKSFIASSNLVKHTNAVINAAGNVWGYEQDIESGTRGYIITGDSTFLEPLIIAEKRLPEELRELKLLVKDNLIQQKRVDSLRDFIEHRNNSSYRLIELVRKKGFEKARLQMSSRVEELWMDAIRTLVVRIEAEEYRLLELSENQNEADGNLFIRSFVMLLIVIVLILVLVFIAIRNNILFRNKAEATLTQNFKDIANFKSLFESAPGLYLILRPDLIIDAVSDEYLKATMTQREKIIGQYLFDVFPDNPDDFEANGVSRLRASLEYVLKHKTQHRMEIQKYDIRKPDGVFEVRYWSPFNKPVLNEKQEVVYIIHSVEDVTVKLQHEKELNSASEEIKNLYDNAPCGYLSVDASIFIVSINKTLLGWLGYTEQEVIGKLKFEDLLSPLSRETHLQNFAADFETYLEKGYVSDLEFEFQRKDKSIFPTLVNSAALKDENGNFFRSLTTVFDNTARKEVEQTLNETLREISYYKFAVDESSIVSITDQRGVIQHVNENFCKISKFSKEELIGQNHNIVNSNYHSRQFFNEMWSSISSGKLWKGQLNNRAKDGTVYWVDTAIIPFLDETGKPFQYIAIRFDITEQKRQQELLRIQSDELIAQREELQEANTELEAQSRNLQSSEEELRAQQEELMQTNHELEQKSQLLVERNFSINEKNEKLEAVSLELYHKAEELALSSRYKSEFLANMSHELRTPLNSILLLSKLLSDNGEGNLSEEQKEFAKVIYNSGNGLLELINDILDLSKIESGKMNIEVEQVDLDAMYDGVRDMFAAFAREKKIAFTGIREEDVPQYIKTDRLRVEQVLKNFLSNAFKFTEKGSVEVNIRKPNALEAVQLNIDAGNFVAFEVKDTGIGIPSEKHAMVFEAFQQADGSTRRKYGGTGLGLSISKEIARMLGGDVVLTSAVGHGSAFVLVIPKDSTTYELISKNSATEMQGLKDDTIVLENQPDKHVSTYIPEEIQDDRNSLEESDKVILIVEDDPVFALSLQRYVRERGYKTIVAVSGADALNYVTLYKPVGVLLDLQLPIKSGWAIMKELQGNPETSSIPVHLMSALDTNIREAVDSGAVDFIAKPISENEMCKMIDKLETVLGKLPKTILLVDDNDLHTAAMCRYLNDASKNCIVARNAMEASEMLKKESVDCVVLEMGLPDESGYAILELIKEDNKLEKIPVIIYTEKTLSVNEEKKLRQFANAIIVKTADSFKRLSNEIAVFLHLVENGEEHAHMKIPYSKEKVLEGKRILVVDDDVRNIFSLTKLLESQQMIVRSACDGKEAIEVLKKDLGIDIILMDMMMPNLDGYEATVQIRKNKKIKSIPIIAVTAKAMLGDRQKCIDAGANDYITKPVDSNQLLSLLSVWLYK